jgi:predicted HTH domain antitoxin
MKKGQMVASRLPEEMVRDLELIERWEQTDRSTTVRKLLQRAIGEWKRDFYARQYGEGAMTLARAAQGAGVSLWEMMDDVRQRKIAAQYDLRDLQHDLAAVLGQSSAPSDRGAE